MLALSIRIIKQEESLGSGYSKNILKFIKISIIILIGSEKEGLCRYYM